MTADKLLAEQPAELVDLVNEHVGYLHGVGKSGCDTRCTADAVCHQRLAQLTGIQNGLDLAVIRVVTAHKADLHQIFAGGLLIADNLGAVRLGGCQRLFAEYRLAGSDDLVGHLGMNAVPCGDDDSVHLVGCNQRVHALHALRAVLGSERVGLFLIDIVQRGDSSAVDPLGQPLEVLLADKAARTDDTYRNIFLLHDKCLLFVVPWLSLCLYYRTKSHRVTSGN